MHMNRFHVRSRRILAAATAAALLGTTPAALAAEPIGDGVAPVYDEAYYATLDYYGNLTEGSVVKSYALNGATTLEDHGTYDAVNNLTDGTEPVCQDGTVTFRFGDDAPSHFYFEGKTAAPFEALPWTLSIHYTLNGVPAKAEDLAGKTGVVEISVDAIPNPSASEYARNNYTLEAMALFNQDDILSLEAPGAQVQLIGNLRTVLFLALPGEEQHFTIRVGSDDFTFDGMTFLMVPATLSQLDEIAKLSERKGQLEDDYDKLSGSLDTLLDAFSGMQSSLNATADGLDQLNQARGTISQSKDQLYAEADVALGDLASLADTLEPLAGHLDTASQALTDIQTQVDSLCTTAVSLRTQLGDLRDVLDDLDEDLADLQSGKGSVSALRSDLNDLGGVLEKLQKLSDSAQSAVDTLRKQAPSLSGGSQVTVNGMTVDEIRAAVKKLDAAYDAQYEAYVAQMTEAGLEPSEAEFQELWKAGLSAEQYQLWAFSKTGEYEETLDQADAVNQLLTGFGISVDQLKALAESMGGATSTLLDQLGDLCDALGQDGLSGTLSALLKKADSATDHLRDAGGVAQTAAKKFQEVLDETEKLNKTVDDYIPQAQQALTDAKALTEAAVTGTRDLHTFLTDLEAVTKNAGTQLDSGTQKTLSGLAASLRQAARSLSTTSDVKAAKNDISSIIEDTWNEHTGQMDNLLNMDSTAEAVSLTSAENPAPQSIQVLIRTQEIQTPEEDGETEATQETPKSSFWDRVVQMFRDFWSAVTGIFS